MKMNARGRGVSIRGRLGVPTLGLLCVSVLIFLLPAVHGRAESWEPLGGGMDNTVFALAMDEAGILYAGGQFSTADGLSAGHIARWDGVDWTAVGGGMNSPIRALLHDGHGRLYAGGYFWNAGGKPAGFMAVWDGDTWSPLGAGMDQGSMHGVYALAMDPYGHLYAGGLFTTAGAVPAQNIARWDGTAWSALGDGLNGTVYALEADDFGLLYAAYSIPDGDDRIGRVARWDGHSWQQMGDDFNNSVMALALDRATGELYAAGWFSEAGGKHALYVTQWDGEFWVSMNTQMNPGNFVSALAVDMASGTLYAGGGFSQAGGAPANRIARWDGAVWSAMGDGMAGNGEIGFPVVHTLFWDEVSGLYAAGLFATADGKPAPCIAFWPKPLPPDPQPGIQRWDARQPVAGHAANRWSFITAWNLETGGLDVSGAWRNGVFVWEHDAEGYRQWIARFVYDQVNGRTQQLAWYYRQVHVQ